MQLKITDNTATISQTRMDRPLTQTFPYADRTLPDILKRQAARYAHKLLIASPTRSITYAQAPDIAARCAGRLASAGVQAGDRVIVFLPNCMDLIELWLGAAWLGAVLAPINTAFRGEQLRHALTVAEPALIVTDRQLLEHLRDPIVLAAADTRIRVTDATDTTVLNSELTADPLPPLGEPLAAHPAQPSDPLAILYTSGTSGPSKGVTCPHAQFFWWGVLTGEALDITSDDMLFTVLPFFHTNPLNTIWQALLVGATFSFGERFSASRFWSQAREAGATVTYLLGAMVHILLKSPPGAEDRAHRIRVSLSPATPAELVEQFQQRFGIRLIDGYGSTETNLVMSTVSGDYAPGTMGRVVSGFEVRIVDANDCDVPTGIPGELVVRHSEPFSVATGYFGNLEATTAAWRNLWFHTGDRALRDERGIYHFVDRKKDAIRRRGENISSWEVEQALLSHPNISNTAVVGVPADVGEEDVMAFIVPHAGNIPEPDAVIRFLEQRIARFAVPRYLEFVDELPLTENGKIKKYVLKERGVSSTTWDRDQGIVPPCAS